MHYEMNSSVLLALVELTFLNNRIDSQHRDVKNQVKELVHLSGTLFSLIDCLDFAYLVVDANEFCAYFGCLVGSSYKLKLANPDLAKSEAKASASFPAELQLDLMNLEIVTLAKLESEAVCSPSCYLAVC